VRIVWWDSANNVYYYFEDHLGSSRVMTQGNGTVCYDADYDPFGKEVVVTNTCPQNYKFNGKERDAESNLDDFGARYYSSQFGRWTSADWSGGPSTVPYAELVNPQSLNLYAYARNNPVTSADLDGHVVAQDTANKMANDLGGQGSWSPRGEEQETGREFDTTDYSCGRLSMVTFGYVDPDTDETIVTSEEVMFSSQVSQGQNQNQQTRARIAAVAERYDGSTAWAYDVKNGVFPEDSWKCNEFVGAVTSEAGAQATVLGKDGKPILDAAGNPRPPTPAEWANRGGKIVNWRELKSGETPQPGDVAAYKLPGCKDCNGHSGIVIGGPNGSLSISAHADRVGPANKQFAEAANQGAQVVYRRYTGP